MHPDQHYIESLRNNDPAGIRAIYAQYAIQAQRWVSQHNGSAADAKDIFQEALLTLYEKAQEPAFVLTCPLGALLHVLYSRRWMDRLRKNIRESGVRKAEELRYDDTITEDVLVAAEDARSAQTRQQLLGAAFAELSELCRQLLRLLSDGVAPRDAAEQLQLNSADTLYRRKNACTQRWRDLVNERIKK